MSTPGTPPPRPRGSHRAAPAGGAPEAVPASPLLLPVLSVLVVLGAIGLAAWMLLTSGDDPEVADPRPRVTQPSAQPSDTASTEPTDDENKNGGDGNNKNGNGDGNNKNGNDKNGNGDGNDKNGNGDNKNKNNGGNDDDQGVQPVPQIPVYVFNQTTISGLAAEIGNGLDATGWNVVGVDNWVGNVPSDTVYFYPGDRAAAERLSNDFPDIGRVWPASAPMPAGALTVILADTARK